ncbi:unnamed protein product [Withania somnifera]
MAKKHVLCLLISIILNIYFFGNMYFEKKLSWTKRAAEKAEAVAAISCSGHGRAYVDGIVVDGMPICECNTCYGGPDCSFIIPDCSANVDGGDPLMYEPFWMENAENTAVVTSGWHRMAYSFPDHSLLSKELEKVIRKLHKIAKNAVTEGKYIVIGVGSTQLLNAAVHALSSENFSSSPFPAKVVAKVPHYPTYKLQTEFLQTPHYEFIGDPSMLNNTNFTGDVFEFVASPNNPIGDLESPVLVGPNVKPISDRVYYWPQYTAIPAPVDDDLMIFSFTKLTGHAGSRLGWAIVKDVNVYNRMATYIYRANGEMPKDTLLRALTILKVVEEKDGKKFFSSASKILTDRWKKISHIFSFSKRFSIQTLPTKYCSYLGTLREPSPAFAWVHCKREADKNCSEVFAKAKIIGRPGSRFYVEDDYLRLCLVTRQDDFDMLIRRLEQLISQEEEIDTLQAMLSSY